MNDLEKNKWTRPPSLLKEVKIYLPENLKSNNQATTEDLREALKKFRTASPREYQNHLMRSALFFINSSFPSPRNGGSIGNLKSRYVRVTARIEIDGKLYALTRYLTWMYERGEWLNDKKQQFHPIELMKRCSKVVLIHQNEFLVEDTLKEISKIFERAVTWDKTKQTTQDLKDQMALLTFLLAHNMRDLRGTSAETEWLESAIYHSHGLKYTRAKDKMNDLEAFANPIFSRYKEVYSKMVEF